MCDRRPAHHGWRSLGLSPKRQNCLSLSLCKDILKYGEILSYCTSSVLVCWEIGRPWHHHTCRRRRFFMWGSKWTCPSQTASAHLLMNEPGLERVSHSRCLGFKISFATSKQKCPKDQSCRNWGWLFLREKEEDGFLSHTPQALPLATQARKVRKKQATSS